jgi:hypothetical protein
MADAAVTLDEVVLGGQADPWRRVGLDVDAEGTAAVGLVRLRFDPGEPGGVRSWALRGLASTELDGLPTQRSERPPPEPGRHPGGITGLDHVVAMTPDLERTFTALRRAGLELRRVRQGGGGVRQGFYRLGDAILEVVGDAEDTGGSRGPARFWGLVLVVEDLDALAARMGPDLGSARDAVQPGRRIATARPSAGLGLPVAFMTP